MRIAHFLHIYQPADQNEEILERVANESYRPLIQGLAKIPKARMTLNINAVLTEMFAERGYGDVIDGLKFLAERGQIEFTGSAKFHALLPLIPAKEVRRQIELNTETNRAILGPAYAPKGFFPPEMAFGDAVADIAADLGFSWMIIDEIAYAGKNDACDFEQFHPIGNTPLLAVFRERRTSNIIMSAMARRAATLRDMLAGELEKDRYLVTAMDGETFGHHRPDHHRILFEMLRSSAFHTQTVSELIEAFPKGAPISPRPSTWSSSEEDIAKGVQFASWKDPKNEIHAIQWEFFAFVLERVYQCESSHRSCPARAKLDSAIASDHFWWASGEPWWSVEMIELGAWRLLETLKAIPALPDEDIRRGETYHDAIVHKAFEWQRSGKVRQYKYQIKIPFKDRTQGEGKPEVYDAFLAMMRSKMQKAARNQEYEKAVLWRDAIWKLETKNDIYDAIHAVDLLRAEVSDEALRKLMDTYRDRYRHIKGGQPEFRGTASR